MAGEEGNFRSSHTLLCVYSNTLLCVEWEGEHFVFWKENFGPEMAGPLFTFNYTANYDGVNGWYYQIGVIKYNFLDYERYSDSLSSGC